jgi:lipoprotein NlpD
MRPWVFALLALVAGCSPLGVYNGVPAVHVVRAGDTLYKIAWQHGVDQRDLVRWNGIRNPDVIYVGQRLRLVAPAARSTPTTAGRSRAAGPRQERAASRPVATASRPPAVEPPLLPPPAWQWPTDGQVVSRFGAATGIATGIAIGGRVGQTVRAAADGRVVYAGSGLIGYGQLVIIKHNDTYLSAYGYNNALRVAQGQDVRRGQEIALMGVGPERQPRLHFEIRRNGAPIDPLPLFAARR